jgi:hypothetical protein
LKFKVIVTAFSFLLLSACSDKGIVLVKGLDILESNGQNSKIIEWESILTLGNLKLPDNTISVKSPLHESIGEVNFQRLADGTSRIAIKVDYLAAKKAFASTITELPNGLKIPITSMEENSIISIPILENSRLYLGLNKEGSTLGGIALNVPALDQILAKTVSGNGLNQTLTYDFSTIRGTAGIYSSNKNGQNGMFIFTQKGSVLAEHSTFRKPATVQGGLEKLNLISMFRLKYLFSKNAVIRIK